MALLEIEKRLVNAKIDFLISASKLKILFKGFTQYLNTPSIKSCKFKCVSQAEVITAIDNLENKNSSGHGWISNKS